MSKKESKGKAAQAKNRLTTNSPQKKGKRKWKEEDHIVPLD